MSTFLLCSWPSSILTSGRLTVTEAQQCAEGVAMPPPRLLVLSYLDKWHLLQSLGSQSWKIPKALRVASSSCEKVPLSQAQKVPSSQAWDSCRNARVMQLWQVPCCSWSQQGNGTDLLSAATLWKCLLALLPYGPDPVSTRNRKTLIFPLSSPLTSFIPLMLQKLCMVLQGTLLPVMPTVWGWCACAPMHGELAPLQ